MRILITLAEKKQKLGTNKLLELDSKKLNYEQKYKVDNYLFSISSFNKTKLDANAK